MSLLQGAQSRPSSSWVRGGQPACQRRLPPPCGAVEPTPGLTIWERRSSLEHWSRTSWPVHHLLAELSAFLPLPLLPSSILTRRSWLSWPPCCGNRNASFARDRGACVDRRLDPKGLGTRRVEIREGRPFSQPGFISTSPFFKSAHRYPPSPPQPPRPSLRFESLIQTLSPAC